MGSTSGEVGDVHVGTESDGEDVVTRPHAPVTVGVATAPPPRVRTRTLTAPSVGGDGDGHRRHLGTIRARRRRAIVRTAPLRTAQARRVRRVWGTLVVLLAVLCLPVLWSYYRALSAPGTDPFGARSVEWLRDHGLGGVVNWVERQWFTLNAPPEGGAPEGGLPEANAPTANAAGRIPSDLALIVGTSKETLLPHLTPPKPMQPFVDSPLPDEGVWKPTGRRVVGTPAVYTAYMRPDPIHTSLVAGFMWMDTRLLKATLVTGLKEPAGAPNRFGARIPDALRCSAIVAFNSAFRLDDARGGFYDDGVEVRKLVDGQASLVIDKDGTADVVMWGRDRQLDPNVQTVRQNLALLVDNGVSAAGLDSEATRKWGATVGNQVLVWRSGVGVDRSGGLIYIGGPGLSVSQLAELFLRAGAVRAMELDINKDWVTAFIYEQPDGNDPCTITGSKLLPEMSRGGDRYLVEGERDFVTMSARY